MSVEKLMQKSGAISKLMQAADQPEDQSSYIEIDISLIDPDPMQPRREFSDVALAALQSSIELHGLLQPISIRTHPVNPGRYMINYGERRYRACKAAGMEKILAVITDKWSHDAQAIENIIREDLSLLERLAFFKGKVDAGRTPQEIQQIIGHPDPAWISRHITIIKHAPVMVMEALKDGRIKSLEVAQTLTSKYKKGEKHEVRLFLESIEIGEAATTALLRNFFKSLQNKSPDTDQSISEKTPQSDSIDEPSSNDNKKSDSESKLLQKLRLLPDAEMNKIQKIVSNQRIMQSLKSLEKSTLQQLIALIQIEDTEQMHEIISAANSVDIGTVGGEETTLPL